MKATPVSTMSIKSIMSITGAGQRVCPHHSPVEQDANPANLQLVEQDANPATPPNVEQDADPAK